MEVCVFSFISPAGFTMGTGLEWFKDTVSLKIHHYLRNAFCTMWGEKIGRISVTFRELKIEKKTISTTIDNECE